MLIFKRQLKELLLFGLVCVAGWQCLEKGMQWAFAVCAIIATSIIYKRETSVITSILRRALRDARQADIGAVHFTRISALDKLAKRIARKNPAFAHILSDLDAQQLSLLILAAREPGVRPQHDQRDAFRSLRGAGLVISRGNISQNAPIHPTQLGSELVQLLIGSQSDLAPRDAKDPNQTMLVEE
jgi:hypothetical protein